MDRFLPKNRMARAAVITAITLVAVLIFTQLLMPGRGDARGTPAAVLFAGLCKGAAAAIVTVGVVLLYRTLRIVNFAQVAMGIAGTILTFEFLQYTEVPFPAALALGVALSAAIGVLMGVLTLRFFSSSRLFLTVFTIVSASVLAGLGPQVRSLPFFPDFSKRTTAENLASQDPAQLLPFRGLKFQVGSFPVDFRFGHLLTLELAVLVFIGIWAFLRYTKAGVAIRALAENSERASLLGIGVGGMAVLVWMISGALAGVGVIARASITTPGSATGIGFGVLLPVFAAAVLGRMTNLPVAIGASIAIAVMSDAWNNSLQDRAELFDLGLLLVIATGLLLQRARGRSETGAGVSWSATDEPRPIPQVLRELSTVRMTRLSLIVFGIIAVLVFPFVVSTRNVSLGQVIALNAIAVVSLVVLTGWSGQVSLAQFAFVAIGAVVGGSITANTPIPFWFAVPLAAAVTGVVAVIVGLPALRIPGLFLLVATFAFALVVEEVLFDERYFGWLLPSDVDRPTFFMIDFENERAMYYLAVATLVLAIVIVTNLRRSRIGRTLIGLRENEANAKAFGVRAVRTKLVAFGIAGALCGMAGAVLAAQGRAVSQATFGVQESVDVFTAAVFGGVSTPFGALLGAAWFQIVEDFARDRAILQAFLQRGGTLFILLLAPGGLISLINVARDSVLRVIAQRRQLVVPSLTADFDAEAEDALLIPLGENDPSSGLGALPVGTRYSLESELYQGRGQRIVDKLKTKTGGRDAQAMTAAARAADDVETGAAPA
ncbi:MAG TPA: ABC transporter permease [Acidimicrobiales bacterium]|nr:ABC transporter permease [Acidimicrobiales bacterium]